MFEKKKTFSEINNEDVNQDLALYYLYIYIDNYENEPIEQKRQIREYYEKNLRYTGAFYRDRKYFVTHGTPEEWTLERKKRFKVETYHNAYLNGFNLYKEFKYKSTYLVNLDLSKNVDISIIEELEGNYEIGLYEQELKSVLSGLFNRMNRIDRVAGKIFIRKGYEPAYKYDLSHMQIIFKVLVNDYIRYFSTKFLSPKNIRRVGLNVLNTYARGLVGLDKGVKTSDISKPSNPPDEELGNVYRAEIKQIYIIKRTTMYRIGLEKTIDYPYELVQNMLVSMVIV